MMMRRLEKATAGVTGAAIVVVPLAAAVGGCGATDAGAPPLTGLTEIESPAGPGSGEPYVAAGEDGRIYMTWLEPVSTEAGGAAAAASTRAGRFSLRYAALDPASGEWSDPSIIAEGENFFVNWADFPSIVALPDGALAAHWLVRSGPDTYAYDVNLARSDDGGRTWSDAIVPHRDGTETEHGFVSLFPWTDGRLAAVWLDGRKFAGGGADDGAGPVNEMTLRHTTIAADGTLGETALLDGRTCDCCQTSAALAADGPVVAYRDRSADEVRDISVVRHVDGEWTEPRAVYDDGWVISACPVNGPSIDADGDRVAVAWYTAAQDSPRVRVAFSDDAGASFGPPVRVDDGSPAGRVDIVMLPDRTALVSWLERTGDDGAEVRVRRVSPAGGDGAAPGAAIGRAMTVAHSKSARASGFPRMVRTGDWLVFAWTVPGDPSRVRVATARLTDGEMRVAVK